MDGALTGIESVLRVGMIGAGDMSNYHLAAWRGIGGAKVVAIANRTLARAEEQARRYGIEQVYDDPAEMLEREELDAVDIVTNRDTHVPLVRVAASHSVAVMCQKPLAPSLAEAEALVAELAGKTRLMVHENRRFAPHFRAIKRWIDDGRVGTPRHCVMTTYRSSLLKGADGKRPSVDRAGYFATEPRLMIGEALIHQLDVLRFLLGPMRVVAARTLHTEAEIAGETVAGIMLEVEAGGAPVLLAGTYVAPGFGAPRPGSSAVGAQTADRFELTATDASVVMTDDRLELRGATSESVPVDYAAVYQQCFDAATAHFVDRLRDGLPFETSGEDNLETLRLVEDAYWLAG